MNGRTPAAEGPPKEAGLPGGTLGEDTPAPAGADPRGKRRWRWTRPVAGGNATAKRSTIEWIEAADASGGWYIVGRDATGHAVTRNGPYGDEFIDVRDGWIERFPAGAGATLDELRACDEVMEEAFARGVNARITAAAHALAAAHAGKTPAAPVMSPKNADDALDMVCRAAEARRGYIEG